MNTLESPRRVVVLPKWSVNAAARGEGRSERLSSAVPTAGAAAVSATKPTTESPTKSATASPTESTSEPDAVPTHTIASACTAPAPKPHTTLALLLLSLAMLLSLGDQCWQRLHERERLHAAQAQLQSTVDKATQLRSSLDALAADTQRLADAGNAPARLLVQELRRRGITINPAAATPSR